MRFVENRVRYVEPIPTQRTALFALASVQDVEGIVGKWRHDTYGADPARTSWVKIKNPKYTQAENRPELFEKRRHAEGSRR